MPHHFSEIQTQILWRIASDAPLAETLEELAHRLQAASPGLRAAFLAVDGRGTDTPRLRVCSAPSMSALYHASVESTEIVPGASPSADVVIGGYPVFIQNARTDARVSPVLRQAYARFDINACYIAPLLEPKTSIVIGVICLYPEHAGAPTPDEAALLSIGASLAGLALHRENSEAARRTGDADLRRTLAALQKQIHTDALTGLPNRALFLGTLEEAIRQAQASDAPLLPAVLFVDLDRFKLVNDTLGHAAGDTLLREVAARLERTVGEENTVARLGGDEFVVLLRRTDAPGAREIARQIHLATARPVTINAQEAFVGASIGIALWNPGDPTDAEGFLQKADIAMYHAKQEGGAGYAPYTVAMGDAVTDRATLEADLRRALAHHGETGELSVMFQPQFDLVTRRMVGAEALIRWQHPRRGTVPRSQFIPIAEESGLIEPLGEWILREACRVGAAWQALPRPLRLAVNLPPKQFSSRNAIAEQIEKVLRETGFDPAFLDLELTENVLLAQNLPMLDTLAAIKRLGVRLLLDDFGTGYGSLLYLRRFPLDVLKIDSSFVQGLSQSREDAAIVRAVIDLAHALGMRVIAKGVETADQLAQLSLLGCDALQGFLLGKPVPASEILRLLDESD